MIAKSKEPLKKRDLLRLFCRYPIKALLIIKKKKVSRILYKDELIAASTTSSGLEAPAKEIILNHSREIKENEDFLNLLKEIFGDRKETKLPVLDEEGNLVDFWSRVDFTLAWEEHSFFSKDGWKSIVNSLPDAILITDGTGRITYLNPAASEIIKEKKVRGKSLSQVLPSIRLIEDKSISNHFINIGSEEFIYDGVPIRRDKYLVGGVYIFRKPFIIEEEEPIKPFREALNQKEKELIQKALLITQNNITAAANLLKIPRTTLRYKLKKLKINI
jgi:transcriptional regulator with PAS, ATPase and Fis domain